MILAGPDPDLSSASLSSFGPQGGMSNPPNPLDTLPEAKPNNRNNPNSSLIYCSSYSNSSNSPSLSDSILLNNDSFDPNSSEIPELRRSQRSRRSRLKLHDYDCNTIKKVNPLSVFVSLQSSSSGMYDYPISHYDTTRKFSFGYKAFLVAIHIDQEPT